MLGLKGGWQNVQVFMRFSGGYFLTTLVNQSLPFLILPILTRYLTPAEYGMLSLFSLYLVLSNSLSGVSIPAVISKNFFSESKEYTAEVIGNSIVINVVLSFLTMVLAAVLYYFFAQELEVPLKWLLLIPLGSLSFVIFNIGLNVMKLNRMVWTFSKHQIGNTAINIGLSLVLIIVFIWGWQGRAAGILISYFLSALVSFFFLYKNGYVSFKISKVRMREVLNVLLPLIPNSVQSVVISQVGIFFIQFYFTKDLLGVYAIGYQIAFVVKLLIITIGMSWAPFLYEQISKRDGFNRVNMARNILGLWGVLVGGMIFVNLVSGLVLRVMTTPDFFPAREFIFPLTIGFVFHGMYAFIMPILIRKNEQRFISITSFINMIIMLVLNIGLVEVFGYMGVAYAFAITYFAMFIMLFWRAYVIEPLPWKKALVFWK